MEDAATRGREEIPAWKGDMPNETRLWGADFVRAAACLIVICHHLAQRLPWSGTIGWVDGFHVFTRLGSFGVAMFFVLSGFLLARPFWQALDAGRPLPSLATYAQRRAARILPGFWLALTVSFVLSFTVFGARLDGQLVLRFLAGLLLLADWHWVTFFPVEVNGPLWSIGFEITSYLLLPLGFLALFAVRPKIGGGWGARWGWLGVIAAALAAHWAFGVLYPIDDVQRSWQYGLIGGAKFWMPRYNPFGFFAIFATGALAAGLQVRWGRLRHPGFDILALAALGAAVWLVLLQGQNPNDEGSGLLGIPGGFPLLALAMGLGLAVAPSSVVVGQLLDNRLVRYVARISFGLYVWHYVVLELAHLIVGPEFAQGGERDPARFVLISLGVAAVSFVIAELSFRFVESPVMRWQRAREGGRRGTPTLSPAAG
jgi:peptidoglycan/LPS O-acetylase OafA/YrhL